MSINSRDDANKYYQMINGLVDDYIDKWKIRPSNLKRYLQPGSERFNRFLERNKLKDIKGASIILRDVIDDRVHLESDGVVTFENFKILESNDFKIHSMKSCLYKGIEKSTIAQEKILADYFDTDLGSINIVDSDKHIYKLDIWGGEDCQVVIYSDEELDVIRFNVFEFIYEEISQKKVQITDSIDIELESLIDYDMFIDKVEKKFNTDYIIQIITDCLGGEYNYHGQISSQYIWSM